MRRYRTLPGCGLARAFTGDGDFRIAPRRTRCSRRLPNWNETKIAASARRAKKSSRWNPLRAIFRSVSECGLVSTVRSRLKYGIAPTSLTASSDPDGTAPFNQRPNGISDRAVLCWSEWASECSLEVISRLKANIGRMTSQMAGRAGPLRSVAAGIHISGTTTEKYRCPGHPVQKIDVHGHERNP